MGPLVQHMSMDTVGVSHMFLQYKVSNDYTSYTIQCASKVIQDYKIDQRWQLITSDLNGISEAASLCGHLYQALMYNYLMKNITWEIRVLKEANTNRINQSSI
eukprot:TRINITY_DN5546_c0_g1_i1.p1 TRINITY_DN5546_c0_g1~~TRINITY_DN5546_c0_g1_i1.p1  ORF type:complete len:103 (-),score=7.76 TRINITY_DN5546_c0_g1_i1:986-1294(-)